MHGGGCAGVHEEGGIPFLTKESLHQIFPGSVGELPVREGHEFPVGTPAVVGGGGQEFGNIHPGDLPGRERRHAADFHLRHAVEELHSPHHMGEYVVVQRFRDEAAPRHPDLRGHAAGSVFEHEVPVWIAFLVQPLLYAGKSVHAVHGLFPLDKRTDGVTSVHSCSLPASQKTPGESRANAPREAGRIGRGAGYICDPIDPLSQRMSTPAPLKSSIEGRKLPPFRFLTEKMFRAYGPHKEEALPTGRLNTVWMYC